MRFRDWTRLVIFGLVAVSCATGVQAAGLIPPSESPDLALVFTGDVIGFLDPCG